MGVVWIVCSANIVAMKISDAAKREKLAHIMVARKFKKEGYKHKSVILGLDQYFIGPSKSEYGVVITKQALDKSGFLKGLSEIVAQDQEKKIPLEGFSLSQIKLVCDLLQTGQIKQNLSLSALIESSEVFNRFSIDNDSIKILFLEIQKATVREKKDIVNIIRELPEDLQRLFIVGEITDYLKRFIIKGKKKYCPVNSNFTNMANIQRLLFVDNATIIASFNEDGGNYESIGLWYDCDPSKTNYTSDYRSFGKDGNDKQWKEIAVSADGNKVITIGTTKFFLWDKIKTDEPVVMSFGSAEKCKKVAFNLRADRVVSVGSNNELWLWDITNPFAIVFTSLSSSTITNQSINAVVFSPDGTKIVSAGKELILWDINNPVNSKVIRTFNQEAQVVAISPDGNKIVSDGDGLALYDIKNVDNIISYSFMDNPVAMKSVIFSTDSDQVFSCYASPEGFGSYRDPVTIFTMWNIRNLVHGNKENLTFENLVIKEKSDIAVFSPQGNNLAIQDVTNYIFVVYGLFTDEEIKLIKDVGGWNIDDLLSLYKFLKSLPTIGFIQIEQLAKELSVLSSEIQSLLQKLFPVQRSRGWSLVSMFDIYPTSKIVDDETSFFKKYFKF